MAEKHKISGRCPRSPGKALVWVANQSAFPEVRLAHSESLLWLCPFAGGQRCRSRPDRNIGFNSASRHLHRRAGPPEHDGSARHQGAAPGPSGDEKAPNHANYDESKANPYPNLPDPLTLNDGQKVTTRGDVVGAAPAGDRGDVFEVRLRLRAEGRAEGHVDGDGRRSRDDRLHAGDRQGPDRRRWTTRRIPRSRVKIHMTLVTPAQCEGAGAGADDVWAGRLPGSQRAARRGIGPDQQGVEGAAASSRIPR